MTPTQPPSPPSLPKIRRVRSFLAHRARLLASVARIRSVATAVEFRRLWWDKHGIPSPAPQRASFWRPVPPPGYVALGDCMTLGMHAPPPVGARAPSAVRCMRAGRCSCWALLPAPRLPGAWPEAASGT